MKKLIFILFLIIGSFIILELLKSNNKFNFNNKISPPLPSKILEATPTIELPDKESIDIDFNGTLLRASWIKITDNKTISLHPNFKEKLSASEFKKQQNCKNVISAGFYDKNDNPLGLLIINGYEWRQKIESNFLNGIFYLAEDETINIQREIPNKKMLIALQSGPLLYENGMPFALKIIEDKKARRIVLAINKKEEIFFIALYDKESRLLGPLLADLPSIIGIFGEKINEEFLTVLNLDGGTASVFYSENISLPELSSVGSFFCITQ